MNEAVNVHKLQKQKVFKVANKDIEVFFREPTVGERISLEASKEIPGSSFIIIKQMILDLKGVSRIEDLQQNAAIMDSIMKTIYEKAPLLNIAATEELYKTVGEELRSDPIFRFKSWVAKELNFPDFMYLADGMCAAEFLRYVVLAEEVSCMSGMFMYGITGDESHLTEEAKQTIAGIERNKLEAQGPVWHRAGLKRPPATIEEKKFVRRYEQEEMAKLQQSESGAVIEQDDVPGIYDDKKPQVSDEVIQNNAIRRAGNLLAQKMKQQELMKAQGMPIPRFDFRQDKNLETYFNKTQ